MKAELFPFQKKALSQLRLMAGEAIHGYQRTHANQVVSFTAPTGAGKTIIMASLIEEIFFGGVEYEEQPEAIFVWLSDSPQLNEQSKDKIDLKADRILLGQCVTISDDSFDQEMLDEGHIYFLNTQKLGKNSNLTKHSDERQYTIWETLANTAREKSDRLYIIIDAYEIIGLNQKSLINQGLDWLRPIFLTQKEAMKMSIRRFYEQRRKSAA